MKPEPMIVTTDAERPAGKPGECFYCRQKVGDLHHTYCVIAASFPVTVRITDTTTGEQRVYHMESYEDENGWSDYIWRDGNYACDCNRWLFFQRATLPESEVTDYEDGCNTTRFRIDSVVRDSTGEVLYEEPEGI